MHRVDKSACDARKILRSLVSTVHGSIGLWGYRQPHNKDLPDWYWRNMILDRAIRRISFLDPSTYPGRSSVEMYEESRYDPFDIACMDAFYAPKENEQ